MHILKKLFESFPGPWRREVPSTITARDTEKPLAHFVAVHQLLVPYLCKMPEIISVLAKSEEGRALCEQIEAEYIQNSYDFCPNHSSSKDDDENDNPMKSLFEQVKENLGRRIAEHKEGYIKNMVASMLRDLAEKKELKLKAEFGKNIEIETEHTVGPDGEPTPFIGISLAARTPLGQEELPQWNELMHLPRKMAMGTADQDRPS